MFVEHLAENVSIAHGDMAQLLLGLQGRADCLATDPPYRLTSGGKPRQTEKHRPMSGGWTAGYSNDGEPVTILHEWEEWLPMIEPCLKDDADLYIMANDKNLLPCMTAVVEAGYGIHNVLAWDKGTVTPCRWYMKNLEFTVYAWKGSAKTIRHPGSRQLFSYSHRDETDHPTEKPVALMEHYIRNSTDPGQVVLDPFMGSGSTGVAAVRLGRGFIGIELEQKWFDVSRRRIEHALRQSETSMFEGIA
jgi:DNA modification methylase